MKMGVINAVPAAVSPRIAKLAAAFCAAGTAKPPLPVKSETVLARKLTIMANHAAIETPARSVAATARQHASMSPLRSPQLVMLTNARVDHAPLSRSSSTESTASSLADAVKLHMQGGLLKRPSVEPSGDAQRNTILPRVGQPRDEASHALRGELTRVLALRNAKTGQQHVVTPRQIEASDARVVNASAAQPVRVAAPVWSYTPVAMKSNADFMTELKSRLPAMVMSAGEQGPGESTV